MPAVALLLTAIPFLGTGAAGTAHVHIQGFAFNPTPATVVVGDTVQWDNHDAAPHTVTHDMCPRAGGPGPCEFDSSPGGAGLAQGAFFSHTFTTTGTFGYFCTIHGFSATLTVVDATGGPDLAVDSVVVAAGTSDTQKIIDVTVRNQGDAAAGASQLRLSYLYKNALNAIGTQAIGALDPGATESKTFVWEAGPLKIGDFRIVAKADNGLAVSEISENNNEGFATATLRVPAGTLAGKDLTNP